MLETIIICAIVAIVSFSIGGFVGFYFYNSVKKSVDEADSETPQVDSQQSEELGKMREKYNEFLTQCPSEKDRTIGARLMTYLQADLQHIGGYAQIWEEEYNYLCRTAVEMIKYRYENHPEDKSYFDSMVKGTKTYKDFITKFYKPVFVKYLKKRGII